MVDFAILIITLFIANGRPVYVPKRSFRYTQKLKYEKPIASRELIFLALIEKKWSSDVRDEIEKTLMLQDEDEVEGLRRRLRAMERDGQVLTCSKAYALLDKLNLIKAMLSATKMAMVSCALKRAVRICS